LISRFKSHNELGKKGFTIRYRPWQVIYIEFFNTKKEAMNREKFLKSGKGREWTTKHIPDY
jgi:putative endonuclease